MDEFLDSLNNNKIFIGVIMILMNLGGRYLVEEIPVHLRKIFLSPIIKSLFIFSVVFIAVRDVHISIFVSLIFIICFRYLFNHHRKTCIIPNSIINIDENNDGIVTIDELKKAQDTLNKYKQTIISNK
jgi:hypothetical protein